MSRKAQIVDILTSEGFQTVRYLAKRFEVTEATIRRDLIQLEGMDLVRRTHGGATSVKQSETPPQFREVLHRAEKAAIGKAMAERVLDGQTILLDSGTTTLEVARHLDHERVTVVTGDLRVGMEIAKKRSLHLVFIGGELLPNSYTMWGPTTVQEISNLRVDVAIFGADTVTEQGLQHSTSYEVEQKRRMRSIAREAFFVADSSKFGREGLFQVFDLSEFTAGISDATLDPLRASQFPIPIIRANVSQGL
ncbi:DeoR/GlpR family DNA-binding transcription regulator [Tessaracoccus defluvii]|uniref:DeoR/GlpR transcriptional regulator n=1 Tax=Tessaracoccus defluvii TaxID=1285901 RepID=A0A7H0H4L6_9ACTN|nr:DeoR/GlpR family DNA-binding transcription regulator [Tessaracoccus defluvii]QNP55482.1 DeoR/GlpR transcriptional regulator [Tessaracoccus defluvii]